MVIPAGLPLSKSAAKLPSVQTTLGLDHLHLLEEIRPAGLYLEGLGVPIARRPRLEDVGDKDILAGQPDALQKLAKELSSATDEGQTPTILLSPRRLADEHQVGIGVARSKNGFGAGLMERASGACLELPYRA